MRNTIFLTAAIAAAAPSSFTITGPKITPSPYSTATLSTTDGWESWVESFQSAQTAAFGTDLVHGTGTKLHFPTNTESRASFLTVAASLQTEAPAIVATLKHDRPFLSSLVAGLGKGISSLESSWSITPSLASATSSATSTGSSNGAAVPVMTAAPIMLGGVAAAAFALL